MRHMLNVLQNYWFLSDLYLECVQINPKKFIYAKMIDYTLLIINYLP